jgi:hypothetical protein
VKYLVQFNIDNYDRLVEFDGRLEAEQYYQIMCERQGVVSVKLIDTWGEVIRQNGRLYGN